MIEKEKKYDPKVYGHLKAKFLESVNESLNLKLGYGLPPEVHIERLYRKNKDLRKRVSNLERRLYEHLGPTE